MCTHYTPTERERLMAIELGIIDLPVTQWPPEVFPGYQAPIVVAGAAPGEPPQCLVARFGLVPRWCADARQATDMGRRTYNARSETAAVKPSYRGPWRERRYALAPMAHFYEPCWESGRAVPWRIGRADGAPFAVAGLWERWTDRASGEITTSFTLLTVNADGHQLLGRMHRPGEEKRMVVIVPPHEYTDWLHATPEQAAHKMRTTPADVLQGTPEPPAPRNAPAPAAGLF